MKVEMGTDGYVVDANDLGPLLGVAPPDVPMLMRDGAITSRFEQGQDEDAGRFRMTFWHNDVRVRLTCADDGTVLSHSRVASPRRSVDPTL